MQEARLSVRVDEEIKKRAESVFHALGLNMSTGISIYLNQVALQNGIPFPLTQLPTKKENENELNQQKQLEELRAQVVVELKLAAMQSRGTPIALYDDVKKQPYLLYPDGRQAYEHE